MEMLPLPSNAPKGVEVRELTPEEIETIIPIFTANEASLPNPAVSTIVGVVRDGRVVGFGVLQQTLHAEPVYLEDGESDQFLSLVHEMEKTVLRRCGPQWVYLFCPAGKITRLAQTMGMQLEPWCVLSKLVMPETPAKPAPFTESLEAMPAEGATQ